MIAGAALAALLGLLAVAAGYRTFNRHAHSAAATSPATANSPGSGPADAQAGAGSAAGFIYGRIKTVDGATYEGRLRWGGNEEAVWGDYFNGAKHGNPWLAQVPPERRPKERHPIEIFGVKIADHEKALDVSRQLTARFGEIVRIEAAGRDVQVTLKSGTVFDLDRLEASDFDDDVRVWDVSRGVVDFDSLRVRSIELLPAPAAGSAPNRLHGTVHTAEGDFTGFVAWDRTECLGTDELNGRAAGGERGVPFDTIRAIARRAPEGCLVTLLDGTEIELSGRREVGDRNSGIYVDDRRYGRVLVSWGAFERVEFSAGGSGPAYGDFPPGVPLTGSIATRDGRRLAGRIVYDLDESETTETFDASSKGIDYSIPFGLMASIVPPGREDHDAQPAKVTLHNGEELQLERSGDLGPRNAGILVFVDGAEHPEYVLWADVLRVDFNRPPAMYPPLGGG